MGIFKQTTKYKKSFHLDEKIKMLDNDLQRTGVILNDNGKINLSESERSEIFAEFANNENKSEDSKSDWKKELLEQNYVDNAQKKLEEEISIVKNNRSKPIEKVDYHISKIDEEYGLLRKQIFEEISQNFLFNIPTVEKKIDRVLEIYSELKEGLLNEPPETDNEDPLAPLNQKFITVDDLNKHYNLFINRIQEQLSTLGGGGETKLKYLDDVVGIATNPSAYDGKYLKYNHTEKKFEFTSVDITNDFWTNGESNTYTLTNVGIGTSVSTSALTVNGDVSCSGIITSQTFFGDGSNLRGISPTSFVPYSSSSELSNSASSISGIGSYIQVGILTGIYSDTFNDNFGFSLTVSADGKFIAAAALQDEMPSDPTTDYGLVYIFERCGGSFNQVGIITGLPYAVNSGDEFGYSMSFDSSGKTLVVGARSDEVGSTGDTGVVYIFDRVGFGTSFTYEKVGIITGSYSIESLDYFGASVDIDSSGKTLIIGAPNDEVDSVSSGLAYVYDRNANNFNQVGILTGTYTNAGDVFGSFVSVSADGKTFAVSAVNDSLPGGLNTGIVYVYDRVGNTFNQVGIVTGIYTDSSDEFGNQLSLSSNGKTLVVASRSDEYPGSSESSGLVYVYDRIGNNFNQVGILTGLYSVQSVDLFGSSVSVSADGNTIAVGAINDEISSPNSTGIVYVYKRVGNSFNNVGILTGFYSYELNDRFGNSLSVSADGKTIIVGAAYDDIPLSGGSSGLVYVYDETKDTYLYSTSNGNIGVGTAVATSKFTVLGDVSIAGIVTATDFNSASDVSLKENILQIENPLDKLLKIDGVNFNWKESGKKSMGVIAQEVEKVIPEVVSGENLKSVNYNGIVGLLIECVKQQQKEIEELKKRLDK